MTTMNPHGISHRLFVAALATAGQNDGKRAAAARAEGGRTSVRLRMNQPAQPIGALAARRLPEWSWSGWQHTIS